MTEVLAAERAINRIDDLPAPLRAAGTDLSNRLARGEISGVVEDVSRVESRPEYLSWEAAIGARKLVEQVMLVKPGEQVVPTGDTSTDRRVVELTAQAVAAAGATPTVIWQNSTLVFDGALWPPAEIGLLRSPVRCKVENGMVTEITGDRDAEVFRDWTESFDDPNMFRSTHWSLGFNPGVLVSTGRIAEDERVFGCVEIGIGTKGAWIGGEPCRTCTPSWCGSAARSAPRVPMEPATVQGVVSGANGLFAASIGANGPFAPHHHCVLVRGV
ncbi:leucyl aminopeptidase (aminopeptidase T) [Saccharopolyspora spinosa]|uniref:Uncharacterized protein n=1 Tax=Saccharopolyspora spinosa TaxID=60894 RepID=A0A2N3Y492_SACSN|nr:leucyl aminopeptidase (aminopeptidase T) [Saccharopolyspora spinosa]PKW17742.1 hypothetical protein A8926_5747 [Saccharopolyspora spinosa]